MHTLKTKKFLKQYKLRFKSMENRNISFGISIQSLLGITCNKEWKKVFIEQTQQY